MSKHTPGSWFSNFTLHRGQTVDYPIDTRPDEYGGFIATVHGAGHPPGRAAANAALIAAAPDLLEAAIAVLADTDHIALFHEFGHGPATRRENLRAAIAKAEGGES